MSHTVVLVEDEVFTLQELELTTGWERLGLQVVGTASDGISGEYLIKEKEPDIVVTDIRLPGQDGLTMLSRCPVNHAVIISGHSDFSYMQQAIRLGVFDYLLKPFEDVELEKTLAALVARIVEEEADLDTLLVTRQSSGFTDLRQATGNRIVDASISFIHESYSQPVGLQQTADYLEISESHLCRLFKETTGINFLQYLNAFRVNKAIEALKDPRLSIQRIAMECGFPNPGYFAKIFKKFTGSAPSRYRTESES